MLNKFIKYFHKTQPMNKTAYIVTALLIIAAFGISIFARYDGLNVWNANKEIFYTSGTPAMTTLDAYKFIRHAKEFKAGTYDASVKDKMIFYPDDSPFPDPVPLLSVMVSKIADLTGMDLYQVSLYIVPIISSIFIIPLAIYFFFIGLPAVGILAGVIATFAPMYVMRSGLGRLDTDGGVLFFLFSASLFVLLAMKAPSRKKMFIFSGLLGVTITLFYTWYHHGMFNLFYLAVLVACLAIAKFKLKDIAIASGIYLICANPLYTYYAFSQLAHAINVYIFKVKVGAAAIFPNVYDTIGEAQRDSLLQIFSSVTVNPFIAIIGLIGCLLLVIGYFKYMIPLLPAAALAGMVFISAGRFAMFLGPLVGAGLAYLCIFLLSYVNKASTNRQKIIMSIAPFAIIVVIATAINVSGNSYISKVLPPSILSPTYQVFKDMKNELPKESSIYTWWDYGLAVAETAGFPVFHSGMTQETPKTWIIAKSFISDQQTFYNIISYLDNYGVAEIEYMAEDNASLQEIENHIYSFNEGPSNKNNYVMITNDMVDKFSAIAYLATWREKGVHDPKVVFIPMRCSQLSETKFDCNENKLDFQLGLINNNQPIKKLVVTAEGQIVDQKNFEFANGYHIIVRGKFPDGRLSMLLLDENAFNSAFVQLYIMNTPDPKLFQLTMDRYPYARIYNVLKKDGEIQK